MLLTITVNICFIACGLDNTAVLPSFFFLEMDLENGLLYTTGVIILLPLPLSKANYSKSLIIHNTKLQRSNNSDKIYQNISGKFLSGSVVLRVGSVV